MVVENGYKQTEVGVIPEDWDVKSLGDLGEVKMCKRIFNNQTKPHGDIPFYKIGTFGKEPDAFISYNLYNNFKQKFSFPSKGTLLISAAGTIGRTIIYDGKPSYFQDSNIVWIDNDERIIPNNLLFQILQIVKYNTEGGTIQRLYNSILKSTKFICPPLPEQTAIANALSDMDALIDQTEKLIEKKKAIKQGVMQELLKPKEGWVTKKLREVISGFQNGYGFSASGYSNKGTPIVTMAQIGLDGSFNLDETKVNRWRIEDFNTLKNYHLVNGDLIIAMTDVTPEKNLIGRMAIVNSSEVLLLNQRVGLLRLNTQFVNPYFLMLLSNMKDWRSYCIASASLGVQANIGTKDILNGEMTLPNIETQNEISGIITELDIQIQLNKTKLQKLKHQKQGMMQALLTGKIRLI